ncbi:23S rRNA m(6)A-1618 methyltransferase [Mucilaginibacter frigoritolerans]|uniref:Ribosomal RNA large subunit methyltransferase F n=1 Tax=Mucilaginibacter frigoritolerans TaxID=652788 RepID=A0A562TMM4_9SPHI|nr:23S rRNA (adenine(1618)-N(6))-methyltransferase RlmF [Mucilaginibacter frigoritolerans]TWI94839.1 23S rRNA m(6)A-1618 methyltransferase [Mucilaginibacter frigoritolerans]
MKNTAPTTAVFFVTLQSRYSYFMSIPVKPIVAEKENLHPRNAHRQEYNFDQLIKTNPQLRPFVKPNQHGIVSINFSDPEAVKILNKSLLKQFYGVNDWDIPEGYLCPPIPGRADYIHYIADLLGEMDNGNIPTGKKIKILDIGTGANCIYPAIGSTVYNWHFVGTDIDPIAIRSAKDILAANKHLKDHILLRQQTNKHNIFKGIVLNAEGFDATICNPPFHASALEAQLATVNKWNKLKGVPQPQTTQNFGGQKKELWYPGGEAAFIKLIIEQSALVAKQCLWFTTLVSKKDTLPGVYKALKKVAAADVRTIGMSQGQKVSRMVAWTFLNEAERTEWVNTWWHKA